MGLRRLAVKGRRSEHTDAHQHAWIRDLYADLSGVDTWIEDGAGRGKSWRQVKAVDRGNTDHRRKQRDLRQK